MSEYSPQTPEHAEALLPAGEVEKLLEATTERTPEELRSEETALKASAETSRNTAATVERDDPLARLQAHEADSKDQAPAPPPNSFLQKQSLARELKSIQSKESKPAQALSKVVHQPVVSAASDVAGKTVSRPSGLLGGGIVALIGSIAYLYLAYHIGFTYQPTVFLLLFIAGFIVGLVLELLIHLVRRSKTSA